MQREIKTPIVKLEGVDKVYPNKLNGTLGHQSTLSNVSLKLYPGEFVFLTGPSGAGKSTLIRLILGLDKPSTGDVHTLDRHTNTINESAKRALRRDIGIVFQDHKLIENFNVKENIALPLYFGKYSKKEIQTRTAEMLEIVQLSSIAEQDVRILSAGEKQRIAIARALITCPKLIVADEPTGNLDPHNSRALIRLFKTLKLKGSTVLIATHNMGLVRDFGGRVLELVGGNVKKNYQQNVAYQVPSFWDGKSEVTP